MYNETQLAAINLFGSKDLTDGLIFSIKDNIDGGVMYRTIDNYYYFGNDFKTIRTNSDMDDNIDEFEILGHEPHLFPDVARVVKEKEAYIKIDTFRGLLYVSKYGTWETNQGIKYSPTLPLLSQPHLSELVNLFSK